MISIKLYNEKWQIHIGDEVWEFEDMKEFTDTLLVLIQMKEDYGKLESNKRR